MKPIAPPTCPYCGKPAVLELDSSKAYSGRNYGPIWACWPCGAWVGCHRNSRRHTPLGRLANQSLRTLKREAHAAFDPFWRAKMAFEGCNQGTARQAAYRWLAEQMGLDKKACHIGMFDEAQCRRVVDLCLAHRRTKGMPCLPAPGASPPVPSKEDATTP